MCCSDAKRMSNFAYSSIKGATIFFLIVTTYNHITYIITHKLTRNDAHNNTHNDTNTDTQ